MKFNYKVSFWILVFLLCAMAITIFRQHSSLQNLLSPHSEPSSQSLVQTMPSGESRQYQIRSFDLIGKIQGLSAQQIKEHETLYQGYVKKRNEIAQALKTVDRSNPNRTYSPFRALKVAETYAVNGQILHELYFENLGKRSSVGKQMLELIQANFGSLENFKRDFIDCAQVSRGWVITAYSFDDGQLHNFVLEEHNQHVPVLIIPVLVLDVYEHAYMIDFGIKRTPYLEVFWQNIDWDVVEKRISTWVNKIRS
jgi:superoxide dismutase, Fe-Mn family